MGVVLHLSGVMVVMVVVMVVLLRHFAGCVYVVAKRKRKKKKERRYLYFFEQTNIENLSWTANNNDHSHPMDGELTGKAETGSQCDGA